MSQVYLKGHLGSYINSQLVADVDTIEAIKCTEEREGQWTNKSSTTVQCKQLMDAMREEQECFIPTLDNTDTVEATVRVELPNIKKVAKMYREKAEEDAGKIPF